MFQIEKNVPPPVAAYDGTRRIYPFESMEVGDSFAAPRDMGKDKGGSCNRQKSIGAAARVWVKSNAPARQFTTRLIDENTVRCWRVK